MVMDARQARPMNTSARPNPTTHEKVDAFEAGKLACQSGMDPLNCPYPEGSILAAKWQRGYEAVLADERMRAHQHGHGSE